MNSQPNDLPNENGKILDSNQKNDFNQQENINEINPNLNPQLLNQEYYDEFNRPKYEDIINYENELRNEIENSSPLVSDKMNINFLVEEFKNSIFEKAVNDVIKKYSQIRTVRRDGNCFYRSFIFRLFEELSINKSKALHDQITKVVEESKALTERNDYQWLVVEDFYNMFISEWKFVYQLDPQNTAEYM